MRHLLSLVFAALAATAFCGVDNVTWAQVENGRVEIGYDLTGRDGFVAVDVLLNGVSVAGKGEFSGPANAFVGVGTGKRVVWRITDESLAKSRNPEGAFSVRLTSSPVPLGCDYLVVELATGKVSGYADAASVPDGVTAAKYKSTHMVFRRIPAAGKTVCLGKLKGERTQTVTSGSGNLQLEPYAVTFRDDYYMAVYETTLGQHQALGGTVPSGYRYGQNAWSGKAHHATHQTDYLHHPMDIVTGSTAEAVASTLTTRVNAAHGSHVTFALPNEDEWEHACRCDCPRDLYIGRYGCPINVWGYGTNGHTETYQAGTAYYGASGKIRGDMDPMPVGLCAASPWGLYDMLGNVDELVRTHDGTGYVRRGGSIVMSGETHVASFRDPAGATYSGDFTGYRLVFRPVFE